ncbi:hypothetical protein [Shewanella marina]|uniref:hypothetical protein n=1 Tax=Shewanella marina TaxID=487319 RepID=UPI000470574A|nr:hypothetical protein [Shewanella marina]
MTIQFIFMLTKDDKTVEDADAHILTAISAGVKHIGFKNIGLPVERLKQLNNMIRVNGATSYLEVVSLSEDSQVESARVAKNIGIDVLLGGTHIDAILAELIGTDIQFYPFPGVVVGHPSVLTGSIDEIITSARDIAVKEGVTGLDLLAYRFNENVPLLMQKVCQATEKPVIMAGSISSPSQINALVNAGAAGFTIGTAAIDGNYASQELPLAAQLHQIIRDTEQVKY